MIPEHQKDLIAEVVQALVDAKAALKRENVLAIERCGLPTYSYTIDRAEWAIAKAKEML